jgi:hypothetical protein
VAAGQRGTAHADSWEPTNLQTPALPEPNLVQRRGFRVEFHPGPEGGIDELTFRQPNGTFVARRTVAESGNVLIAQGI